MKTHPVAPTVYRPQTLPKVLQTKKVGEQASKDKLNAKPGANNTIQRAAAAPFVAGAGALAGILLLGFLCSRRSNQKKTKSRRKTVIEEQKDEAFTAENTAELVTRATDLKKEA